MLVTLMPLLKKLFTYLLPFIQKKVEQVVETPAVASIAVAEPVLEAPKPEEVKPVGIDWNNPKSRINKRFSVKDATYLPSWGVSHIPSAEEKLRIVDVATRIDKLMDKLEAELGKKLVVDIHCWMRPGVTHCPGTKWDGMSYNDWLYENVVYKNLSPEEKAKKKIPDSPHKRGNAVDYHIVGYEGGAGCDKLRELIMPHLEELGLRMEDKVGSNWVHNDSNPVISHRFFKP